MILMLVFSSLLVLTIFFLVFIITDIKSYQRRKSSNMISLAQVVGTNSISTLQFHDDAAARQILFELQKVSPEIMHAAIYDENNQLFANFSRPGLDTLHVPASLKGKKQQYTKEGLFVRHEIIENNEVIGTVILESDLVELQQVKSSKYEIAATLLAVALVFSFILALTIQSYITRRLVYLANNMKELSDTGNYDKVIPDTGKDEISTMIKVFNELMQQVKENQRRKDEFIGIASHELKTPLTSVKGYMELLKGQELQQPYKQFIDKGLENVIKLEMLIRDLLDVSKIQSGQLELNMKEFSIDELLDEAISGISMISKTHEIIKENPTGDEIIKADRQRIEQVLINLLSNAIKYSPGGKKVIVQSSKTESELIIKIRDFGMGVPQDEQLNIFERFYRTKDQSVHISGFGLGLYISRDIIRRHNGKIWVEAEERGSGFYFSLPLNQPSSPQENGNNNQHQQNLSS